MRHAFTVDVEEWFHGIPIEPAVKASAASRIDRALGTLLDLLDEAGVRGTFFVLGPLAETHASLVRRIAEAGHEVGCHGWSHDLLYTMSAERMREETQRAKTAIEQVIGRAVTAYRAAYFSITRTSLWALDVLAALGFKYDSSIFPVRNWRYGIAGFDPRPQRIETSAGTLYELPLSIRNVLGVSVPVSGGAYFRLYPYALTRRNFRALVRAHRPVVFYIHPWELDPEHPRVAFHWRARLTHYANLRSTEPKLRRLLRDFEFAPLGAVLEDELAGSRP